jgi:hypothetical protein
MMNCEGGMMREEGWGMSEIFAGRGFSEVNKKRGRFALASFFIEQTG